MGMDVQGVNWTPVVVADQLQVDGLPVVVTEDLAQVRMRSSGPQEHRRRERAGAVFSPRLDRSEAHDYVGRLPLRADEGCGVLLSTCELPEYLALAVAPVAGVPRDLPSPTNLLRRVEVHGQVETGAAHRAVEGKKALDDHYVMRFDQNGPVERPV